MGTAAGSIGWPQGKHYPTIEDLSGLVGSFVNRSAHGLGLQRTAGGPTAGVLVQVLQLGALQVGVVRDDVQQLSVVTSATLAKYVEITSDAQGQAVAAGPSDTVLGITLAPSANGRVLALIFAATQEPPGFLLASIDVWVDSATGDDDNPGTQAFPLETLAEAFTRLGPYSGHCIIHLVGAGPYTWTPGAVFCPPVPIGVATPPCIQGEGETVVASGTVTGTTTTTVTASFVLVADANRGQYIKFTSGVPNGKYSQVDTNAVGTASTFTGLLPTGAVNNVDTVAIVEPQAVINITQAFIGEGAARSQPAGLPLSLVNLKITGTAGALTQFQASNVSFDRVIVDLNGGTGTAPVPEVMGPLNVYGYSQASPTGSIATGLTVRNGVLFQISGNGPNGGFLVTVDCPLTTFRGHSDFSGLSMAGAGAILTVNFGSFRCVRGRIAPTAGAAAVVLTDARGVSISGMVLTAPAIGVSATGCYDVSLTFSGTTVGAYVKTTKPGGYILPTGNTVVPTGNYLELGATNFATKAVFDASAAKTDFGAAGSSNAVASN